MKIRPPWHRAGVPRDRQTAGKRAADPVRQRAVPGREQQAIDNTRELAENWLEQARASGQDITRAELAVTVTHEPLFGLGSVR